MPEPNDKQTDGQDGQGNGGGTPPVTWEEWLKAQPEEVRAAYEGHTKALKSALQSERDARGTLEKAERDRKAAEQAAEQERLQKQGEYQKLAEQHQARITELEKQLAELAPVSEKLKSCEAALTVYLSEERKGLPPHVLALLDNLDAVKQLEWIAQNQAALKAPAQGGIPPTPPPGQPGKMSDEERRKRSWQPRL